MATLGPRPEARNLALSPADLLCLAFTKIGGCNESCHHAPSSRNGSRLEIAVTTQGNAGDHNRPCPDHDRPTPHPMKSGSQIRCDMNIFSCLCGSSAALGLLFSSTGPALATPAQTSTTTPAVIVLQSLGHSTYPNSLNEHDEVAGIADTDGGSVRAVRWDRSGRITNLGTLPGGTNSTTVALNDAGVVAGNSITEDGHLRAVRWDKKGNITDLGTLPGYTDSIAEMINNRGTIAGQGGNGQSPGPALLWDANGSIVKFPPSASISDINDFDIVVGTEGGVARRWDRQGNSLGLGRLPNEAWSVAREINNAGTALGYAGTADGRQYTVRWDPRGRITALSDLPGSARSEPVRINSRSEVAGFALTADMDSPAHAVRWDEKGRIRDLGTLGGRQSRSFDINDAGTVVGWADISPNTFESHATRWDRAGRATDLGTLPQSSSSTARQINNIGTITGLVTMSDYSRAVMWPASRPRT